MSLDAALMKNALMEARYVGKGATDISKIESVKDQSSQTFRQTDSGIRSVRLRTPFSSGLYKLIVTISFASLRAFGATFSTQLGSLR